MKHRNRGVIPFALCTVASLIVAAPACTGGHDADHATDPTCLMPIEPAPTPAAALGNDQPPAVSAADSPGTAPKKDAVATRVVLVTASKACKCTMKRCKSGETVLETALKKFPEAPALERIDYAKEPDKAKALAQKYKMALFLPMILLLDGNADLVDVLQGELNETDVGEALGRHVRKER